MDSMSLSSPAVEAPPDLRRFSGYTLPEWMIEVLQDLEPLPPNDHFTAYELQQIQSAIYYTHTFSQRSNDPTAWYHPAQPEALPFFEFKGATFEAILEEKTDFNALLMPQLFFFDQGTDTIPMFERHWPVTRAFYNFTSEVRKLTFQAWSLKNERGYAERMAYLKADGEAKGLSSQDGYEEDPEIKDRMQRRKWIGTLLFLHGEPIEEAGRFC